MTLQTPGALAADVARDLKRLFEHAHESARDDLVTAVLLLHIEALLQQHEAHLAKAKKSKKKKGPSEVADPLPSAPVPTLSWEAPPTPEPPPRVRPAKPVEAIDISATLTLL